jgi:eukaryotic-like serine/threonine-protein kinase
MTPERWERIKELVDAGLEREMSARARFLDEECAGDPSLRAEVGELIASYEQAAGFMVTPAFRTATQFVAEGLDASLVGQRIGPYRNVRELGRGGMGVVFLAVRDDEAYRKEVAIKVIKRGMDTEAIIRAFRSERQILADFDNPYIARLVDGGTTHDGRPYFVMDHVEGLPLDVYCDTHKLPIVGRLTLFRTICSAVHYAHQHGVIHRDLKPGNILVTGAGVPKLLDFGIAKVLNPGLPSATTATTPPFTPAYASPEQIRGEAITSASDIYSLGVLLYELLTGHPPYRLHAHTPPELERVICKQEPKKPSAIICCNEELPSPGDRERLTITPASVSDARGEPPRRLRDRLTGDLDTIVLTAMRKDPQLRYASVEQFSEDIRRHLDNLPIAARRDTLAYRTAKFVRRNRASVITATLSVALMLVLLGTVGVHPFPPHQVAVAVLPFEPLVGDAQDEYLEVGLADALISKLGGIPQLKVRPTQQVLKYRGPGQSPQVAGRELGVDMLIVGNMQRDGDRFRLSLKLVGTRDGNVRWAQSFDERWTEIFAIEDAITTHVADALALRLTGTERQQLTRRDTESAAAYQEYLLGRDYWTQFTAPQLKRALEHFQRAVELDSGYALAHAGIADCYASFATYRVLPASEAYPRAREAALKALELNPDLSEAYSTLAMVSLYYDWDWRAAESHLNRAIQLNPDDAEAHNRYAVELVWVERFDEAVREILRARELDPLSRRMNMNVGWVLHFARQYDQSIQELNRAVALDPNFFQTHQTLGWSYVQTGTYDQAIAEYKRALELGGSSQVETDLAHAYAVSGRTREANALLRQIIDRTAGDYVSPFDVAIVYVGLGDRDQAFAWLEKAYQERTRPMLSLKVNPRLDPLRSDPRFVALVRRMRVFDAN